MADAFVRSYTALSNAEERIEALKKLTHALSFAERKALVDAVLGRNDIVPALPLELLIQVFKHLHTCDAWSLQLVNRRWRATLSSHQFIRAVLREWSTHNPSDSGRSTAIIADDSLLHRIRHMQSLRLGKAFSQAGYDDTGTGLQGPQAKLSQRKMDLKGKNVAYISSKLGESDAVILRDLVTGSVSAFHGEARERILTLALSTDLLAFVTLEGYLHVTRFTDSTLSVRRKLPSAHVIALSVDSSTVALATYAAHATDILLFNLVTLEFKSLSIDEALRKALGESYIQDSSILVNDHKRMVDLFTLAFRPHRDPIGPYLDIVHLRISFDGDSVSTSAFGHEVSPEKASSGSHFTMVPPVPTGYRGLFRIQVAKASLPARLPLRLNYAAIFDTDAPEGGRFLHEQDSPHCEAVAELSDPDIDDPICSKLHARWKTLALRAKHGSRSNWVEYVSLMNDSFFVSLEVNTYRKQDSRIKVFCFDNLEMYGCRSTGFWEDGQLQPIRDKRIQSSIQQDRLDI